MKRNTTRRLSRLLTALLVLALVGALLPAGAMAEATFVYPLYSIA